MADEAVSLMVEKVWQPIRSRRSYEFQTTFIPYSKGCEIMGRRGFRKNEARVLGQFFQSRNLLTVSKHGWLVKQARK